MGASYKEFLEDKAVEAPASGFHVEPGDLHPWLKPHARAIVQWGLAGGCRAYFTAYGLHKTSMQLETLRQIVKREGGPALQVAPLGVRQEFFHDAQMLGMDLPFIRSEAEIRDGQVNLVNYETIRDGKIDPKLFTAASLDEADVLRSYGSKTFQEFLPAFEPVRFKFVASATPSPNRFKELIHYAGFLGVMDTGQALTRFFQRNSEKANDLTLYPHKEDEFWLWVSTWAIFLQKPSDLGFSDEGYELPELEVRWHEVQANIDDAGADSRGQGKLLRDAAVGLQEAAREKRDTLATRIAKLKELREAEPENHFLLWHDLEAEREALEDALPSVEYGAWQEFKDGHPDALAIYERHYSAYQYADGRERKLLCGPGFKTLLMTQARDALFVWRKFKDDAIPAQEGVNCSVFRNEGPLLSSDLIREAMAVAWLRWPGDRLYTYVNAAKTSRGRSKASEPGKCFLDAGWSAAGKTKGGLDILEALPDVEVPAITPRRRMASVYGTQDLDEREEIVRAFKAGTVTDLAAKPVMLGAGGNLQAHCHRAIFAGIGHKFRDIAQAWHRIQRFGQTERVVIDMIYAETEREIRRSFEAKWARDIELRARMTEIIRQYGLGRIAPADAMRRSIGVERAEAAGEGWSAVHNDCVDETARMGEASVGLILTSIPFGTQYEYCASYNDFGHNDDNAAFFRQMDFLTPELLRILKPGRHLAVHVKDRIRFASVTGQGVPTVDPFHADCIDHYRRHGFAYMGLRFIQTDVVRENNQTYRLGYSEMRKDATKMGAGSPEFVLIFRKAQSDMTRGYADEPVAKPLEAYSLARWQVDADAFWRSSGDRLLSTEELAALPPEKLSRAFTAQSVRTVYDHDAHVAIAEALLARGALPKTFAAVNPGSWAEDAWHDIVRMRTLNAEQSLGGREKHVCPLQIDIVDRIIRLYSNPGDLVFDPFAGLFTVPVRALHLGRRGAGAELNADYFRDGVRYLRAAEMEARQPTLFDVLDAEAA